MTISSTTLKARKLVLQCFPLVFVTSILGGRKFTVKAYRKWFQSVPNCEDEKEHRFIYKFARVSKSLETWERVLCVQLKVRRCFFFCPRCKCSKIIQNSPTCSPFALDPPSHTAQVRKTTWNCRNARLFIEL